MYPNNCDIRMLVRYPDGHAAEGVILSFAGNVFQAMTGSGDVLEVSRRDGEWFADDGMPVKVDFACEAEEAEDVNEKEEWDILKAAMSDHLTEDGAWIN